MSEWTSARPDPALPTQLGGSPGTPETPKTAVAQRPRTTAPKWELEARDRLKAALRRFARPLAEFRSRDANEGDTRFLVTDLLTDALGYDKYDDLTTEYQVKGEFADYGVRIDKQLIAFIEVKRITQKLGEKHLRQVQSYAVNEGIEWLILTNAAVWQAWHLTGGLPVRLDLAFEVDLLSEETISAKAERLFYLTRESLSRRQIDDLWKTKAATSPDSLGSVLASAPVLQAIRRELRRKTGQRVETEELARLLRETVLRPECLLPLG